MSFSYPDGDLRTESVQHYIDLVKERSGGLITIKLFPAGMLAVAKEELDMVKSGNLDMTYWNCAYDTRKVPIFEDTMLPFYAKHEQLNEYINQTHEMHAKHLVEHGVKLLPMASTHGYMQVYNNSKFLKSPADWVDQMMRISGGYQAALGESMGAGIVSLSAAEQYMALQLGTAQGTATSGGSYMSYKLYEVAPYVTKIDWQSNPMFAIINMEKWESLPESFQKIMLEVAPQAQEDAIEWMTAQDARIIEDMKANGAQVYVLTSAERQVYIDQAQPLWDEFKGKGADEAKLVEIIRGLK